MITYRLDQKRHMVYKNKEYCEEAHFQSESYMLLLRNNIQILVYSYLLEITTGI
jgi:hypothetical protein